MNDELVQMIMDEELEWNCYDEGIDTIDMDSIKAAIQRALKEQAKQMIKFIKKKFVGGKQ